MSTIVYLAVPLFLVLMAVEILRSRGMGERIRGYEWRDTLASLSMGVGNVVISMGTKVVTLACYTYLHQFALFDLGFVWRLRRLLKRRRIELLHLHNHTAFVYGAMAGRLSSVRKIVYTEHGRTEELSTKARRLQRFLSRSGPHVLQ